MPPETRREHPIGGPGTLRKNRAGSGDDRSVTDVALRLPVNAPRWRRQAGCPCGCRTRRPWLHDPECIRYRPLGPAIEYPDYDVETLGLVPHDRARCEHCQAVSA